MRVWVGSTGVPIAIFEGHPDSVVSLTFSSDASRLASGLDNNTVRFLDCATVEGRPQPLFHLPLVSQLAPMSVDTILGHDDDADDSFSTFNINPDRLLSSEVLSMSLCESKDPSRNYYIQGKYCTKHRPCSFTLAPGGYCGNAKKGILQGIWL